MRSVVGKHIQQTSKQRNWKWFFNCSCPLVHWDSCPCMQTVLGTCEQHCHGMVSRIPVQCDKSPRVSLGKSRHDSPVKQLSAGLYLSSRCRIYFWTVPRLRDKCHSWEEQCPWVSLCHFTYDLSLQGRVVCSPLRTSILSFIRLAASSWSHFRAHCQVLHTFTLSSVFFGLSGSLL